MTWPLIACCSVIVADYSDTFKPEYIIPQLLLQWVRSNQRIDGISYNSTHIDFHSNGSRGDFSNLVMPVKEIASEGQCKKLKAIFKVTEPISWQLKEFAIGGQTFISDGGPEGIDRRIPNLELIKGRAFPYSFSVLGSLESYLIGMPASDIK